MKILFVSLGCDKNLVDSEEMLGDLTQAGYEITDDEDAAEAAVINTCCFIRTEFTYFATAAAKDRRTAPCADRDRMSRSALQ